MCGRFIRQKEIDAIISDFGIHEVACDLKPSYNVAPTQQVAIIIEDGVKQLIAVRWGLVPYWAESLATGNKLINARAETIDKKAAFKEAFQKRRCLVVADGFYEWQKDGKSRQPILIRLKSGASFGFAGLYENWVSPAGENIRTCTIITTEPNEIMLPIHDRMPAIIRKEDEARWLDPGCQYHERLLELLQPYPAVQMETCFVSTLVNSPSNDLPECIVPAAPLEHESLAAPLLPFAD